MVWDLVHRDFSRRRKGLRVLTRVASCKYIEISINETFRLEYRSFMKKLGKHLLVVAAVVASSGAWAQYSGPKIKFRLAHTAPPGNHITLAYKKFADIVSEKSDKKIQVQLLPGAVLGSDRVLIEGAQKGTLEMGVSSTPNLSNFSSSFQVFDLPYITSPKFQQNLYKSLNNASSLNKYLESSAHKIGLQPVMYAEYGYRHFFSTKKPLNSSADLAGLKMRTTDSPVEIDVAKSLGTNPAPIAWGEVYTALQQGTIDAEGNTFAHLYGAKHHEALKYGITSSHNYGMQVAMANKAWWDGLPAEAQKLILSAAAEATEYQRTVLYPQGEADARKGFIAAGVKITDPSEQEIEKFKAMTKPVYDKYAEKMPAELLNLVIATQK